MRRLSAHQDAFGQQLRAFTIGADRFGVIERDDGLIDEEDIITEVMDPYATRNPVHRGYHRRNRARGRMGGQLRIRWRYQNLKSPWFDYLFVSREELGRILAQTPWRVERVFKGTGGGYVAVLGKRA